MRDIGRTERHPYQGYSEREPRGHREHRPSSVRAQWRRDFNDSRPRVGAQCVSPSLAEGIAAEMPIAPVADASAGSATESVAHGRRNAGTHLTPGHRRNGYRLERGALGLLIKLSSVGAGLSRDPDSIVFSDESFECRASDITALVRYIRSSRQDIVQRVDSGDPVTLLSPQADPPVIRVTKRSERNGYFNVGELWRAKFMKRPGALPFKRHQGYGVKWLHGRSAAVLADDMGLGKTLQAIAALEEMKASGTIDNALVLCPKSLIGTWEAEIRLWAPRLCTVALYSGVDPKDWHTIRTQCHVAVTNYEAIRGNRVESGSFDLVIFDEIHKLKNPSSLNYMAAFRLNPRYSWGLSGTPIENHAGDLTAILHLLDRKRVSLSDRLMSPQSLRRFAASYVLRRPRKVISNEVPAAIERTEMIPLSDEQRRSYDAVRAGNGSIKTVGSWISSFNKLRSICDYDPTTRVSSKVDRALVIIDAIRELREKVVVFSWRLEPLRLVRHVVNRRYGRNSVAMITGKSDSTTRSNFVRAFQSLPEPFVLLCSTRATAEGLTLTAANHVVFLNEWWNPAVNAQARDRVSRIGQARTVYVYRLRSQGTVESDLDDLLATKSELFHEIVARLTDTGAEQGCTPVPDELLRLVR